MKRYWIMLLLTALTLSQYSCRRTLETEPQDRLTDDLVFDQIDKNADNARAFLMSVYQQLPDGYNRIDNAFLDCATDDAVASRDGNLTDDFRKARISPQNVIDNAWERNYNGIRRANIFLAKVDRVPTTTENKQYWKAETRFLRAFFYFELLKRWGGVPLMGDTVLTINDQLNYSRNTTQETVQYILAELNAVQDLLLPPTLADADYGRATKGAAMALKARLLLYWASPLYNTSNDPARWSAAANAAADIVRLNNYTLATDFIGLFISAKNTEFIFNRQRTPDQSVEQNNGPVGYLNAAAGKGFTSPSQELVDAFPMNNGLPITDTRAQYDPANPYDKRDPRLAATVFYNGSKWLNRSVETFDGGLDKPGGIITQTKTGYYLRKFMGKFESASAYSNQQHHVILLRYAEVLLNLAEARNEEQGPVKEVVDALFALRKRAGILPGTDNRYGIPATVSQTELRTIIQNERRIELAFEEHRHWDLRRWKLATATLNKPVTGMRITARQGGAFSYTRFEVTPATFADRLYWYPIPYSEIETNPNMRQNNGWNF